MAEELTQEGIERLRERVEPYIAEPFSDEGQEVIGDSYPEAGHVTEVWEDGELTTTKGGDLYRARRIHQRSPPVWPEGMEVLFDVEDGDHKRMVVTDVEALNDILDEYR